MITGGYIYSTKWPPAQVLSGRRRPRQNRSSIKSNVLAESGPLFTKYASQKSPGH